MSPSCPFTCGYSIGYSITGIAGVMNPAILKSALCGAASNLTGASIACCGISPPVFSLQCIFTVATNQNTDTAVSKLQSMLPAAGAISQMVVVGSTTTAQTGSGPQISVLLVGSTTSSAGLLTSGATALIAAFDASVYSAGKSHCSANFGVAVTLTVAVAPGTLASPALALGPPAFAPKLLAQPLLTATALQSLSSVTACDGTVAVANKTVKPLPVTYDYDVQAARARARLSLQTASDRRYTIAVLCTLPFTLCPYRLKRSYALLMLGVFVILAFTLYRDTFLASPVPPSSPSTAAQPDWLPTVVTVMASPRTATGTVPAGVTVTLQCVLNSSATDTAGAMWNQLDGPPVRYASSDQMAALVVPGSPALVTGRLTSTLSFAPGTLAPGQQYMFQCLATDFFGSTPAGSGLVAFQVDNSGAAAAAAAVGGATLSVSGDASPWTVTVQPTVPGALYSLTATLQSSTPPTGGLLFAVFTPQSAPTFVVPVPTGAGSVTIQAVIADSGGGAATASASYPLPTTTAANLTNANVTAQAQQLLVQPSASQARMLAATLAGMALQKTAAASGRRRLADASSSSSSCDVCATIAGAAAVAPPEQALLLVLWAAQAFPQGVSSFATTATVAVPAALQAASTAASQAALDVLSVAASTSGAASATEVLARTLTTNVLAVAVTSALSKPLGSMASVTVLSSTAAALAVHCDVDATLSRLKSPLALASSGGANFSCFLPDNSTTSPALSGGACVCCLGIAADPMYGGAPVMQTAFTRLQASSSGGGASAMSAAASPPLVVPTASPAPIAAVFLTNVPAGGATCSAPANASAACAALPAVIPADHWVQFNTSDPWNPSWILYGPLTAGCTRIFLNCTSDVGSQYTFLGESQLAPPRVYLSPDGFPFGESALQCVPASNLSSSNSAVLFGGSAKSQAFYGESCELWRPDNKYNCYWDAPSQQFLGPGCVVSSPGLTCMCAQFPVAMVPLAAPAALEEVVSQNLGMPIPSQVPLVLIEIVGAIGCCGILLVFVVGLRIARRSDNVGVGHLRVPEVGYVTSTEGAWLWALHGPAEIIGEEPTSPTLRGRTPRLARPQGSAVAMARIIGLPLIRLRAAMPDVLWPTGTMPTILGRPAGLASDVLEATQRAHATRLRALFRAAFRLWKSGDPYADGPPSSGRAPSSTSSLPEEEVGGVSRLALFTGTALMYAHIAVSKMMPQDELVRQEAASAAALSKVGMTKLGRWTLHDLRRALYTMLSADSTLRATGSAEWQDVARAWCLVLSQRSDGSWDPDKSFAAVMRARVVAGSEEDGDDEEEEVRSVASRKAPSPCPVTFSVDALLAAAPRGLRQKHERQMHRGGADPKHAASRLQSLLPSLAPGGGHKHGRPPMPRIPSSTVMSEWGDRPTTRALRTWCTLLGMELLRKVKLLPISRSGTTPLDRAYRYLEVRNFFPAAEAWEFAARQAVDSWEEAQAEAQEAALRSRHVRQSTLQRWFSTTAVAAVQFTRTHHDLLSVFLAPRGGVLTRPQRAMIAATAFLAPIAFTAFLLSLRAQTCCTEIRSLAKCGTDASYPCRGVEGVTCAQLSQVLSAVQDTGLAGYVCHRFPDPNVASDIALMGSLVSGFTAATTYLVRKAIETVNNYANNEINGGAVIISQPSGFTMLMARLRAPDHGVRFKQRLWRAAQHASEVERNLVAGMMVIPLTERIFLFLTRTAALPLLGWELLMRKVKYRKDEFSAVVAQARAAIPAGPWIGFVWAGVIALMLVSLADIRWYEGEAALTSYVLACFISYAIDMLMQFRDLYQELFTNLLTYLFMEITGLRPAEDTWAEVLNFLSLQALLLPAPGQDHAPPPSLAEQVNTMYRASRSVDDM